MIWRLIRENEEGFADFPWDRETQNNFRLTKHITQLEAGEVVRLMGRKGGVEWYLIPESEPGPVVELVKAICPMCGGSGTIAEAKTQ